ncbi:MAG: sigma-54-dependent Fis family transcriptional regulator, partial [Devosia sp.]|nr:sigma-54-dependent Fis family transcriptional regulator [Devosia sp.]
MPAPGFGLDNAVRILLVERDEAGARSLIEMLDRGFIIAPEIALACGGREAADRLRLASYDLLLADLDSLCDLSAEPEDAVARLA